MWRLRSNKIIISKLIIYLAIHCLIEDQDAAVFVLLVGFNELVKIWSDDLMVLPKNIDGIGSEESRVAQ